MNSPIIIQIIASFLDVETLLNFGKTCKLIRKISQADSHWEKLFILKYTSDLEFFG